MSFTARPQHEAPAQQDRQDLEDKDLNAPEVDNELDEDDKDLVLFAFQIKCLSDILKDIRLIQTDLHSYIESINELLSILDDDRRHYHKSEVKNFHLQCKLVKAKWEKLKQIVHPITQEHPDHEEEQKPVDVENNVATKKQRLNDPE